MATRYKTFTDFDHYVTLGAENPLLVESVFNYINSLTDERNAPIDGDFVIGIKGGIPELKDKETPKKNMSFEDALRAMKNGEFVRLPFWSPEVRIGAQYPDENSKMTHPYLYVISRKGCVPWKETYPELFSNEWEIYEA